MNDPDQLPQWRQEFLALPEWAQQLVRGLASCGGYGGGGNREDFLSGFASEKREQFTVFHILLHNDHQNEWWGGFFELIDLAAAMTAPWPAPVPKPHDDMTTSNVVEMMADEDCAFDQPCHYGHRVENHAVYCHHDSWPDSPSKCRRNRDDFRHEDCPGFAPNTL